MSAKYRDRLLACWEQHTARHFLREVDAIMLEISEREDSFRRSLESLVAQFRAEASAGDTEEECFMNDSANRLEALLKAKP